MPDGRVSLPAELRKRHGLAQGDEVIVCHYAKFGASRQDIEVMLRSLPIQLVQVDEALSYEAGMLRPITLPGGLSLGDRYCLALAKREGVAAMTAERRWPDIATAAGVVVDVIR